MPRIRIDMNAKYIDHQGYEIVYTKGENDLGLVMTGEIYHHFNGLMLLAVI